MDQFLKSLGGSSPEWVWAIPLFVAFIALLGVMLSLVFQWQNFNRQLKNSRALKIAEMRQQWINNLRKAMATYAAVSSAMSQEDPDVRSLVEHGSMIELMMNPDDRDYEKLRRRMQSVIETAPGGSEEFTEAHEQYVAVSQRILKREWERLKRDIKAASD